MGQGQGCCGGRQVQELNLDKAAKNAQTPGHKAFFKRQSTSLTLTANINTFYGNLVISCVGGGKCGSEFSKLCVTLLKNVGIYDDDDYKDIEFTEQEKRTVKTHFWSKSEELRQYFILLLENTENEDKYVELYDNLNDETYKISDDNTDFMLSQFLLMIKNDDFFLLQCLSNVTCTFGSRPLFDEITENAKDNDDLIESAILEKVEIVKKSKFYKKLKEKGIELAENEILAVYIYTVNTEFADLMQKKLKIPCKWKQTFYYFVRGILKIFDAVVYSEKEDKLPFSLYHPVFGQSSIKTPFQMLSPINCTASKKKAEDIAPPDGTMYRFENVAKALSKGKLIAAPIDWISDDPTEKEWVILPLKVLDINETKEVIGDNCKVCQITTYSSFSAALYGVDIYTKLAQLRFVKQIVKRNII